MNLTKVNAVATLGINAVPKQRRGAVAGGAGAGGRISLKAAAEAAAPHRVKKLRMDDVVAWFELQEQMVQVETLERLSASSIRPESTELLEQLNLGLVRGADTPGKEAMLRAVLGRLSGDELARLLRTHMRNAENGESLAQQLAASLIEESMSEASRVEMLQTLEGLWTEAERVALHKSAGHGGPSVAVQTDVSGDSSWHTVAKDFTSLPSASARAKFFEAVVGAGVSDEERVVLDTLLGTTESYRCVEFEAESRSSGEF